jgi:hypothetical protein
MPRIGRLPFLLPALLLLSGMTRAGRREENKTLERWTQKLGLHPDQQTAVQALLAVLDGSEPRSLDFKTLESIDKILTPEQRVKFANLREVKKAKKCRFDRCCPPE